VKAGEFGETENHDALIIQYRYEIERNVSITGSLLWDILPSIESNLNILLIEDIFDPCQDNKRKLGHAILNERSRQLEELRGMSPEPIDFLDDASCISNFAAGNECRSVLGYLSVYLKGGIGNARSMIKSSIKKIMDEDRLLSSHEAIVKISYVSQYTVTNVEEPINKGSGILRAVGIVLGALAGVMTIVSVSLKYVMRDRKQEVNSNENDIISGTISEWTEVMDSSYVNSSNESNISDEETVLISNRRIRTRTDSDEMVVDFDIDDDEYDLDFFNVIFDGTHKIK